MQAADGWIATNGRNGHATRHQLVHLAISVVRRLLSGCVAHELLLARHVPHPGQIAQGVEVSTRSAAKVDFNNEHSVNATLLTQSVA